jgi:hypothetical protein
MSTLERMESVSISYAQQVRRKHTRIEQAVAFQQDPTYDPSG